jgi:ribonucleases P/MRP protein subunit RPP40
LGFGGNLLEWMRSYLTDRRYFVRFGTAKSFEFIGTSGVPAGTHGGPDLFLVMINDLPNVLKHSKISIYADDSKIYKQIRNESDSQLLQDDLHRFYHWCEVNKLQVNVEKCCKISFSRSIDKSERVYQLGNECIPNVDIVKDLGVDFSSKMSFSHHINRAISTASKVLGFIRRFSRDFHDPMVSKTLFCTLVRPHLEYGGIIWSPSNVTDIARVEAVQRKFTKFICNILIPQRELSYADRCLYLNLDSLENRRKTATRLMAAGILNGEVNLSCVLEEFRLIVPRSTSRSHHLLKQPCHRLKFGESNPLSKKIREFNVIQDKFDFHLTRNSLKSLFKQ